MSRYRPILDIWALSQEERTKLQPGQWVFAGTDDHPLHRGVFCGVRPNGSTVVMWQGNAKGRRSYREYRKTLMEYGRVCQ